jgi:hypothetical protein
VRIERRTNREAVFLHKTGVGYRFARQQRPGVVEI